MLSLLISSYTHILSTCVFSKIILNINNEEYESEIKYTYIGRKKIFEDEEVESYYNYCCNEQGD